MDSPDLQHTWGSTGERLTRPIVIDIGHTDEASHALYRAQSTPLDDDIPSNGKSHQWPALSPSLPLRHADHRAARLGLHTASIRAENRFGVHVDCI